MTKLNKKQIIDLLPHREPMLLIDELYDIVELKSATAIVNVKKNSFFAMTGHIIYKNIDRNNTVTHSKKTIQ